MRDGAGRQILVIIKAAAVIAVTIIMRIIVRRFRASARAETQ
jgi:hypothetical protein